MSTDVCGAQQQKNSQDVTGLLIAKVCWFGTTYSAYELMTIVIVFSPSVGGSKNFWNGWRAPTALPPTR